jgi:hypothetical protein
MDVKKLEKVEVPDAGSSPGGHKEIVVYLG